MINNTTPSFTPVVSATTGNNSLPQPVPMEIYNTDTVPASMAVVTDNVMDVDHAPVLNDITPDKYVAYMKNERAHEKYPRTFRNIKYSPSAKYNPNAYQGPMHFDHDKFIDVEFYCFNIGGKGVVEFKNCTIETSSHKLNWLKMDLTNTNWEGSTIDGLYRGSRSEIRSCYFSDVQMPKCTLKNFKIYDSDTDRIERSNFSDSTMENMVFSGCISCDYTRFYLFKDTRFCNMQAINLTWDAVDCVENVDLTNAQIKEFTPSGGTKLTGVEFGDYQKDAITINPAMFNSEEKIDLYLDSINNHESGALFLNTLDSITNLVVKCDFAEQLIKMIKNESVLSATYNSSITLRQSIMSHLANPAYAASPEIQTFIRDELLKEDNDIIIPANLRPMMYRVLSSLDSSKLLDHQFMVNQLITEYPLLRQKFYQLTPINEFIRHIEEKIMMPDENSLYHIFYHPDDRKTALYLPAADYKDLIESNQAPQHYSFLKFQPGENDIITDKSATVKRQSRVLGAFPALHNLWIRAAGLFTPVIHSLFEHGDKLDTAQMTRAAEIENHLILIIKRQADENVRLTDEKDACLLSEIMAPFYIEGDRARGLRWQLVELIQRQLGLKRKQFSVREQKIIAFMIIIRMLPDIFSTHYYSIENMSPYAPRQLAKKLIDDLVAYAPEIVDAAEATVWRNRLVTDQTNEFTCSAALATRMGNYQIPGDRGQEMNKAIKLYYPLN
ncbi:MAG: hypothetical protein PW844_09600 [Pantoea sp.]|uniref:hypothetical protein n=1 Tax=Pantoea sp. TaxID=69393 RepID=UPI002399100B|nr:hypothetical protein [Pantoea sp.]MDE1186720.1 hypothetical protein [Pantoea sp.]